MGTGPNDYSREEDRAQEHLVCKTQNTPLIHSTPCFFSSWSMGLEQALDPKYRLFYGFLLILPP
jgi:hypothetical protein